MKSKCRRCNLSFADGPDDKLIKNDWQFNSNIGSNGEDDGHFGLFKKDPKTIIYRGYFRKQVYILTYRKTHLKF